MIDLVRYMRPKVISLDLSSWEYASKMKNFSGWVRQKLREEMVVVENESRDQPEYWAYCAKCDLSATSTNKIMMEYKYCPKCHDAMEFKGLVWWFNLKNRALLGTPVLFVLTVWRQLGFATSAFRTAHIKKWLPDLIPPFVGGLVRGAGSEKICRRMRDMWSSSRSGTKSGIALWI